MFKSRTLVCSLEKFLEETFGSNSQAAGFCLFACLFVLLWVFSVSWQNLANRSFFLLFFLMELAGEAALGNYSDLIVVGVIRRKQGRGRDDGFEFYIDLEKN